jgi:hypothetical protein
MDALIFGVVLVLHWLAIWLIVALTNKKQRKKCPYSDLYPTFNMDRPACSPVEKK